MKILLAEDDQNISTIALLTLEQIGNHEVCLAENGEEALSLALEGSFDVILLDEMMPKMNGIKVSQAYKDKAESPVPVIFLSAKSQAEDVEQFKKNGIGHIAKPFDPSRLCSQIEDLLKNHGVNAA